MPEDAATETADIHPESENCREMAATVATVAAAGIAAAAFEASLLPGVVELVLQAGTGAFGLPASSSRDERPALWRGALRARPEHTAECPAELER